MADITEQTNEEPTMSMITENGKISADFSDAFWFSKGFAFTLTPSGLDDDTIFKIGFRVFQVMKARESVDLIVHESNKEEFCEILDEIEELCCTIRSDNIFAFKHEINRFNHKAKKLTLSGSQIFYDL